MRALLALLLVLPAWAGDAVRLSFDKETTLTALLEEVARTADGFVFYDPECPRIKGVRLGTAFSHEVERERLFDTYRAILAFFEVMLVPLADQAWVAIPSRCTGSDSFGPQAPSAVEPARHRVAVAGLGGRTVLALAYPAHACLHHRAKALPPETRDRLIGTLRGVHAEGRRQAARLLGLFGPRDAAVSAALKRALLDEEPAVRAAARAALAS